MVAVIHFDSTIRTIIDGANLVLQAHCRSKDNAKILGCHVVGERAVEIAEVAAIAISAGMRVDDLARVPLAFPTYTGNLAYAAAAAARQLDLHVGWEANKVESNHFDRPRPIRAAVAALS